MDIFLLQALSMSLYVAVIFAQARPQVQQSLAWCACALHLLSAILALGGLQTFSLNVSHAVNVSTGFLILGFLISSLQQDIRVLGRVLYPFAIFSNVLAMIMPLPPGDIIPFGIMVHIIVSVVAFAIFALGALEATLILILRYRLKNHRANTLDTIMPPLQTLESLLFHTITGGTIMLSMAIFTGAVFVEQFFSAQLIPKTAFTLVAWCLFSILLAGRALFGWSGQRITQLIVAGYLLLLIGFIGVKWLFAY